MLLKLSLLSAGNDYFSKCALILPLKPKIFSMHIRLVSPSDEPSNDVERCHFSRARFKAIIIISTSYMGEKCPS
jgi:hypothetical protein